MVFPGILLLSSLWFFSVGSDFNLGDSGGICGFESLEGFGYEWKIGGFYVDLCRRQLKTSLSLLDSGRCGISINFHDIFNRNQIFEGPFQNFKQ